MRVTREHNEECKRLLRLMGVPVLEAPTEAEAQCAQLCKDGLVSGWGGCVMVEVCCVFDDDG